MQLVKTNICRAAVCDKCQKMALRGGRSARPRMVSQSYILRKYYVKCYHRTGGLNETGLMSLTDISLAFLILTLPPLYIVNSI